MSNLLFPICVSAYHCAVPEFLRCHACLVLEELSKVRRSGKTEVVADVLDTVICTPQQSLGFQQDIVSHPFRRMLAGGVLNPMCQML